MRLLRKFEQLTDDLRGGAVAIGNFDGVHIGHARIVQRLTTRAHELGGPAIAFTFDPHPVRILRPELAPPPLTWIERKAELLAELGVDAVLAYPTDEAFLSLTAQQFFDQIIRGQLAAKTIIEGPNFYFGKNREGSTKVLQQMCDAARLELEIVEPMCQGTEVVSSSRVRCLIAAGNVEQACQLLTSPYRIRGMVTHGAGRGAKIGFPTANVEAIDTLLPRVGVYAGVGRVADQSWPAGVNIGTNPTFGEKNYKVEVHLSGFDGALYGKPLEVDFLARLRDIHTFDSIQALQDQLTKDVSQVEEIVELQKKR